MNIDLSEMDDRQVLALFLEVTPEYNGLFYRLKAIIHSIPEGRKTVWDGEIKTPGGVMPSCPLCGTLRHVDK